MPNNVPPELKDKFDRCVQKVMEGGEDEQAAYAICYTSVVEGKSEAIKKALDYGFVVDEKFIPLAHSVSVS